MSKSTAQYLEEAIRHYNKQHYQEALRIIEHAIQLNPASVRAVHGRGIVLTRMKEYNKAKEAFEQACKLAPNTAKIYLDMAEVLYKLEDYEKSGLSYRKAVEFDGTYESIYAQKTRELFHKAIDLRSQGLRDEALDAFQQVLLFNPKDKGTTYYISDLQGKLPAVPFNEPYFDTSQPAQNQRSCDPTWNNEWGGSYGPPSIHPANCRCYQCWEP